MLLFQTWLLGTTKGKCRNWPDGACDRRGSQELGVEEVFEIAQRLLFFAVVADPVVQIVHVNPELEVILPVSVVAGLMVIERSLHGRLGVGLDYCQSIFQRTIVPELWRMLERLSYRNIDGHLVEPLEDETRLNISPPFTKYFLANLTCTGRAWAWARCPAPGASGWWGRRRWLWAFELSHMIARLVHTHMNTKLQQKVRGSNKITLRITSYWI